MHENGTVLILGVVLILGWSYFWDGLKSGGGLISEVVLQWSSTVPVYTGHSATRTFMRFSGR